MYRLIENISNIDCLFSGFPLYASEFRISKIFAIINDDDDFNFNPCDTFQFINNNANNIGSSNIQNAWNYIHIKQFDFGIKCVNNK